VNPNLVIKTMSSSLAVDHLNISRKYLISLHQSINLCENFLRLLSILEPLKMCGISAYFDLKRRNTANNGNANDCYSQTAAKLDCECREHVQTLLLVGQIATVSNYLFPTSLRRTMRTTAKTNQYQSQTA